MNNITRPTKPTIHVMLDVETTGLDPKSHRIWQIGGVASKATTSPLYVTCNPNQFLDAAAYDPCTIQWQQDKNAENWTKALGITSLNTESDLIHSLIEFVEGLKSPDHKLQFWSKGAFDFQFLKAAADRAGVTLPWSFRQENDLRTLCNIFELPVLIPYGAHDALQDAKHQLDHLINLLNIMGAPL